MNIVNKKVGTLTWAASSDKDLDLSNSGFLTAIDLELVPTMSATDTQVSSFGYWRMIQALKIQGGSGKVYYNPSGTQMGVMMHYLNLLDHPGKSWRQLSAAASSYLWRIQFSPRTRDVFGRDNPFDLGAAIPAMDETNLKVIWTTTANTAVNNDTTISSATMYVTEYRVLPENKAQEMAIKSRLMVPQSSSESYDPGATKSDLSGTRYVPTGKFLKRIAVMATDATAYTSAGPLFKGDQVTEFGLKLDKSGVWIIDHVRAEDIQCSQPPFDGMDVVDTPNTQSPWAPAGFYNLDLRKHGDPDFGLDTRGWGSNDLILGMTIGAYSSAEVEQIFYEQYEPYAGRR